MMYAYSIYSVDAKEKKKDTDVDEIWRMGIRGELCGREAKRGGRMCFGESIKVGT
jgi:hypothetical protein